MIYSCSRPQHRHRHAHRACFLYGMLARLSASHDTRPTHYRRSAGATSVLLPVMMTPCRRGAPEYASKWARLCGASRLRGFVEIDGENRAAPTGMPFHLSRMTRGARCTSSPNPPLTPSSFLYARLHHSPGIPRRPRCDISALRPVLASALASFSTPRVSPQIQSSRPLYRRWTCAVHCKGWPRPSVRYSLSIFTSHLSQTTHIRYIAARRRRCLVRRA